MPLGSTTFFRGFTISNGSFPLAAALDELRPRSLRGGDTDEMAEADCSG
jgi:hypothetical protein